jgi:hypothetical protein
MSLAVPTPQELRGALDRAAAEHGRRRTVEAENERLRVENEHLRALFDSRNRVKRSAIRDDEAQFWAERMLERIEVEDDYITASRRAALAHEVAAHQVGRHARTEGQRVA